MSMQAQAWAIRQTTGSPSAKATLWSIANYANDMWAAWPKQSLIAVESEQSEDSVGKRIRDLAELGLMRRIKLKRGGRRTVDFLILAPSPLFAASLDHIAEHLPAGCVPMPEADAGTDDAAANDGSVDPENAAVGDEVRAPTSPPIAGASETDATLPQSAGHAPATVREPVNLSMNQESPLKSPQPRGEAAKEGHSREVSSEVVEPLGFAAFWQQYPDHETDNRKKAVAAFVELAQIDRDAAGERVSRYAAQIAKTGRRPVGAHRWLSERRFSEFAPGAQSAVPQRWFVPEGSEPWAAVCALGAVAFGTPPRIPQFWGAPGGAHAPLVLRDNWRPWCIPYDRWVFLEEGTPQFGRWVQRVQEMTGRAVPVRIVSRIDAKRAHRLIGRDGNDWTERDYRGLLVPLEWPPGRHAKDPPLVNAMNAADRDELVKL